MNRTGKILASLLGVAILLVLGLLAYIFYRLPSSKEINKSIYQSPPRTTAPAVTVSNPPETAQEISQPKPTETAEQFEKKKAQVAKFIETFTDERRPLSEVCIAIHRSDYFSTKPVAMKEFGSRFNRSIEEESHDPLMESIKPILKFSFQQPAMKSLVEDLQTANNREEADSLMSKAYFYKKAYDAYTEMTGNKEQMEQLMDQSYLLLMLSRAVELKPELKREASVLSYCEDLEKLINENESADFNESKKAFSDFLAENQIDPKKIDFDPEYKTTLEVNLSSKGLHFRGGWIEQVMQLDKPAQTASH